MDSVQFQSLLYTVSALLCPIWRLHSLMPDILMSFDAEIACKLSTYACPHTYMCSQTYRYYELSVAGPSMIVNHYAWNAEVPSKGWKWNKHAFNKGDLKKQVVVAPFWHEREASAFCNNQTVSVLCRAVQGVVS